MLKFEKLLLLSLIKIEDVFCVFSLQCSYSLHYLTPSPLVYINLRSDNRWQNRKGQYLKKGFKSLWRVKAFMVNDVDAESL